MCYTLVLERPQLVLHPLVTSTASEGQANRKRNLAGAQVKNRVSAVETKVHAIQPVPGRITTRNTWKTGNWASDEERILHTRVEGLSIPRGTALCAPQSWSSGAATHRTLNQRGCSRQQAHDTEIKDWKEKWKPESRLCTQSYFDFPFILCHPVYSRWLSRDSHGLQGTQSQPGPCCWLTYGNPEQWDCLQALNITKKPFGTPRNKSSAWLPLTKALLHREKRGWSVKEYRRWNGQSRKEGCLKNRNEKTWELSWEGKKNKTKQYGNGAGRYKQECYKGNEKLKRLFFMKEQTHLITTKS